MSVIDLALAASPAYVVKAGSPLTPADLSGHAIILGLVSQRIGDGTVTATCSVPQETPTAF
jgi:hypothetical protein